MKIVSIINYKGGVGKTTVTSNLAAELAWQGHNVLMIDLDPQTNLTFSFLRPADWERDYAEDKTIKLLFDSLIAGTDCDFESLIIEPDRAKSALKGNGKLDLICSHLGLINVDLELATLLSGANLKQTKQNFLKVHRRLAEKLELIPEDRYDVVLIDCPPNFNIVTKTAIVASDFILVPTRPDFLSTLGIDYLIRNVDELVSDYNDYAKDNKGGALEEIEPATIGVLFNMIQERNSAPISAQDVYIRQIRARSGLDVFDAYIKRNDTLFANAPESGVPVVLTGQSGATYVSVVDGLEETSAEFAGKVGL